MVVAGSGRVSVRARTGAQSHHRNSLRLSPLSLRGSLPQIEALWPAAADLRFL